MPRMFPTSQHEAELSERSSGDCIPKAELGNEMKRTSKAGSAGVPACNAPKVRPRCFWGVYEPLEIN